MKPRLTIITADTPWNRPEAFKPDLYASLRERKYREPLLDRIANALGSERFLFIEIGFVIGCFTTVGLAFVWSVL